MDCSKDANAGSKNPKRVAAGRRNRQKRGDLKPEVLERLRKVALANQPWLRSTGPRTIAGKARSAANGLRNQPVPGPSGRRLREELAGMSTLMNDMAELRKRAAESKRT